MNRIEQLYTIETDTELSPEQMTINVARILPALAHHLYGDDWRVSIRELLQNAQDAITRRIDDQEDGLIPAPPEGWAPRIRVWLDRQEGVLVFEDNGIGLTLDEIRDKIATIGESGHALRDMTRERRLRLIGQFGIGFLSAFIVGETVTVVSQSATDSTGSAAVGVFTGETTYRQGLYSASLSVGTRIIVKLKERYLDLRGPEENLANYQLLEKVIRKFCDNLPAPITLHENPSDENGALLSSQKAPWDEKEPSIPQLQEYLKKREEPFGDIAYVRRFVFTSESDGIDAMGVVYFPKGEEGFDLFHDRYPNVLFVRRIYITTGLPDLLPSWLTFCGVIAECPDLPVNLSRDSVVEHAENFVRLRERLSEFIIETCATWTKEATFIPCYRNNIGRFTESIANSAGNDPKRALFRMLVPALPFEVRCSTKPRGEEMTLKEYEEFVKDKPRPKLEEEHKTLVLYLMTREDQGRLRAVAVEQPYPVLYLDSGTQRDIIIAYASLEKGNYACDIRDLYPGKQVDEKPYQRLRALCFALRPPLAISEVKVSEFSPSYIPALLISGGVLPQAAEAIDAFIEQGGAILPASLVAELRHQVVSIRSGKLSFTLYLNASNMLINQLVRELELQPDASETVGRVVNELILSSALPLFEDPKLTEDLMRDRLNNTLDLLGADNKLGEVRQENTLLEAECKRRLDPQHALDVSQIPAKAVRRDCAVLILDLKKSTWMLGNLEIEEGGRIFEEFVDMVAGLVRKFSGHFDKFTGDGVLAEFFPADEKDEKSCQKAARDAFECAKTIANEIDNFFSREPWRKMLADANLTGPKTRSALAWGHVNFGRYSGAGTAVGAPMVVAARLCNEKEFFTQVDTRPESRIIGTERVCELIRMNLHEAAERLIERNWEIEGLAPVTVYRLDP